MMMKDSLFLDFDFFRKGVWGQQGANNDDEGFFVSADLKCFGKGAH